MKAMSTIISQTRDIFNVNFWLRLIVIAFVVSMTGYLSVTLWNKVQFPIHIDKNSVPPDFQAQYYQACWSICGLTISIFVFGVTTSSIESLPKSKRHIVNVSMIIMALGTFATTYTLYQVYFRSNQKTDFIEYLGCNKLLIDYLPILVSFLVLFCDFIIAGTMRSTDRSRKIMEFDLVVVIGTFAILAITQMDFPDLHNKMSFSGGASATQLIFASLLFDPSLYTQPPQG
jgi:hypothetical protein